MAREGLDVVLIERGNRPGEKNVMSGILYPDKLIELVPDFVERAPLQRRVVSSYIKYYIADEGLVRFPDVRDYREDPGHPPYYTVFRSQFDDWFAQEAVAAGAELFTATLVEDLLWQDGRVAGIRSRRGDLRARVVVGADGIISTVAEKAGLRSELMPHEASLILRQVFDLPADVIEERFALRPGEGVNSRYDGLVKGPNGVSGLYYSEMYTMRDALTLSVSADLSAQEACGVPVYKVLEQRERHPYIARLLRGAELREYQAHLIPRGGIGDLKRLYGDGVLLAGDAGKFNTAIGVGSWPAMASGAAAAQAVEYALEKGDFSRRTLGAYLDLLDEEEMLEAQREAAEIHAFKLEKRAVYDRYAEQLVRIARRYFGEWRPQSGDGHGRSILDDAFRNLVKPLAPWHLRLPLGIVAWLDTLRYRWEQVKAGRRG
jgi:electron transfer flavoprotein-quinone oxidoreductase